METIVMEADVLEQWRTLSAERWQALVDLAEFIGTTWEGVQEPGPLRGAWGEQPAMVEGDGCVRDVPLSPM